MTKKKNAKKTKKFITKKLLKKIKGRHPSNKSKESKVKKLIKLAKINKKNN